MKAYVLTLDVIMALSAFAVLLLVIFSLLIFPSNKGTEQLVRIGDDIALQMDMECPVMSDGSPANLRNIIETTPWNICVSVELYNSSNNLTYSTVKTGCARKAKSEQTVVYFTCYDNSYGKVVVWYR